jgi:hypothetical protein
MSKPRQELKVDGLLLEEISVLTLLDSLIAPIEELLEWKCSGSGLENKN